MKKNKFLFIHIPKTAGTSVLNALSIHFRQHYDFRVYRAPEPKLFSQSFKFCFVRNPYSRMISTYRYLTQEKGQKTDAYIKQLISDKHMSFDDFVEYFCARGYGEFHPLFKTQSCYIYDVDLKCKVDFVGRFENLDDDFKFICSVIGKKQSLERVNVSKKRPSDVVLTKKIADMIYDFYKLDFELLDYDKDSWQLVR
ncbi:sulfotransferase family 2 domain-containing protein [Vibrio hannami]|nr:sulfotransferase family 2 domain-containing protein [Vibrio hannami]MDG3088281.1 sulfotransferase family 2 domain-containing protein [Vibrio hannami]